MPYAICAFLNFLFAVFACVVCNWWLPLLADKDGNLPRRLRWFQTFDNTLDAGWAVQHNYPAPRNRVERFWCRVKWLYRNPVYGFGYWPMGAVFDELEWEVLASEKDDTHEFFHARTIDGLFSYFYVGPWGTLKLGWKAWNYYDATARQWKAGYQWGPEKRVPLCFTYIPWKRRP